MTKILLEPRDIAAKMSSVERALGMHFTPAYYAAIAIGLAVFVMVH